MIINIKKCGRAIIALAICVVSLLSCHESSAAKKQTEPQWQAFADNGYFNMLYDRRQRPASVSIGDKVHIVINGNVHEVDGKVRVSPCIITYDTKTKTFSDIVELDVQKTDHHYAPVIFSDNNDYLHVLYGCHKEQGTHIISKQPNSIGTSKDDWVKGADIASSISYPTFYRISGSREILYHRHEGHSGAWTYTISDDNGQTWTPAQSFVTDLDSKAYPEYSSYQTKLPSKDGKYLHVVFTSYDDCKKNIPERLYNPRYKRVVKNSWKYNLYYVRIDTETGEVTNFDGQPQQTPIHLDQANADCMIWDTDWRGAGVPPDIVIDKNGNPAMLHVLSEETTEQHNYYFVRYEDGQWKQTVIRPSNHQWNSSHIALDKKGNYHAYLIVGFEGETYFETSGKMANHGGGRIEEWVSKDNGNTWNLARDLTPTMPEYQDFRFSNIQPVTEPDGSIVDGLFLFYGYPDKADNPTGTAFLMEL